MEQHATLVQEGEVAMENAAVIFQGHYQRILRYIMSMVRDSAEAEDLTQETFMRAYRGRDSLREEDAQTAWLYRIATNVCLDRLRQYARRGPMKSEDDLDQMEVAEANAPSLLKLIEQDEMSECVQGYINQLPDNYRAVILLHDMHGVTSPEIAQLLDVSLSNVKIRLHRARVKLRGALRAGCDFSYDERNVMTCDPSDTMD